MTESPSTLTSTQKRRFGQALIALPGQYVKVLTRPSIKTFVEEKEKANWGMIWFQMLLLGASSALILAFASSLAPHDVNSVAKSSGMSIQDVRNILVITTGLLIFILTPISFLLFGGMLYLIARMLGGKGTYLEQISVTLLFGVPMVLLSALLGLIPATNRWLPWLPHIYSVMLLILALIAVHRREGA